MAAEHTLGAVILAALVIYALSGGADYGGGMWDLLAMGPRAPRQREAIEHAIGPIWEANHVWLILVIVVLFTGFPWAFATVMTALHIPMTAILLGIVLRGSAFVFRKYDAQDDAVHRRWSALFGAASFFMAATYLTVDTEREPALQADFRKRGLTSGLLLAPAAALTFILARDGAPHIFARLVSWWAPLLVAVTSACALGALVALWSRRFRWARAAAIGQVTCILLGWGLAQYPHIVVPDLTLSNTATVPSTLRALQTALAVGAVVLFPAFGYLFYVFKRRPALPPD